MTAPPHTHTPRYSSTFGDWDISKGVEPNEAEILMYGGEMEHANVPLFVSSWHLGGDLKSDTTLGEDDYLPISVKVSVTRTSSVTSNIRATRPVWYDSYDTTLDSKHEPAKHHRCDMRA